MGGYEIATRRLGTTHCRFGMRPAPAVFRDLQTGFGDKFPCTRTSDQPAKIGQRRHPNGTGHHVCRKFIEDLLGQVDRQVFQMVSGPFAFRIHQTLRVFEIGKISTTRAIEVGAPDPVWHACGGGDSLWVPLVVLGVTRVSGGP